MTSTYSPNPIRADTPTAPQRAFIEVQFPVAKLSAESYKERKGAQGQTLTGLGKWWGRKPLVLVRGLILGLLMPASDDPEKDRETFLALMTMDDEGLERRRNEPISAKKIAEILHPKRTANAIQNGKWISGLARSEKEVLRNEAFAALPYEEKIKFCARPEEIDGPSPEAWERINAHLGTSASSLSELVQELGQRRFRHTPTIGDAFCGGGSIPFEAARLGCDVYASDINPVAGLLTWAALNIVGGGERVVAKVRQAQQDVYDAVCQQVDEWGIERNEQGWIADAYLYCNEVRDPRTGWLVPLAPSWVIARRAQQVIAQLIPVPSARRFEIAIHDGADANALTQAAAEGTWSNGVKSPVDRDGTWLAPHQRTTTSVEQLRGPNGLRLWENDDLVPRPDDVFQERLYCIRWRDPKTGERHYCAPTEADLQREAKVLALLRERFADWQAQGFIPSREIEPGYNTSQPIRERGWTRWHHLFNPRQLLLVGLLSEHGASKGADVARALLLMDGRVANWNSRLTGWDASRDQGKQTFYNQALNTLNNYSCRPLQLVQDSYFSFIDPSPVIGNGTVELVPAQEVESCGDIWITDPGYGDMVNYDEISEYFLAWYDKQLVRLFPNWYADSRRALTIKGEGEQFRLALTEAYANLTNQMRLDGYQILMFTHKDPSVWADVGLTIWAAGLQVITAWTVVTETPTSGVKGGGDYTQATVSLVLRKRTGNAFGYLSDITPEVEQEVKTQLESMRALDDDADPSFGDADYQLAAYAAALRVLTSYSEIGEIDIKRELSRPRVRGEESPITKIIEQAVEIATNVMVPRGIEERTWRRLGPDERLYLKGIEVEASGEGREGIYQELARAFGAQDVRDLYAPSSRANQTRFKTPSEFRARSLAPLDTAGFAGSFLRRVLLAVFETAEHEDRDPRPARQRLSVDFGLAYWQERDRMIELLRFLRRHSERLPHWQRDNETIDLLISSLQSHRI